MSLSFDLYQPGDSWLHRLDPRAKLWMVLLIGLLGLLFRHVGLLAALLLLTHLALLSARVPVRQIWWLWVRMAPILVMILLLQPIFMPGPGPDLLHLGPLRITIAGLLDGLSFALRAAAMAFVAAILLLATDPTELVQGLVKLGLPYPWGLTAGLAIRYLPIAYGLFVTVSEAQQARGWILGQGNLFRRARSYLPIFVATIIASLRLSTNLGLALAARGLGYPARRTVLHDIRFSRFDWLAVAVVTMVFLLLLGLRFWLGFGADPR
jgi:energy-coupling factor transport system permease protein